MSSRIQKEMSQRVWKDKLDLFFSQPVDQYYDSMDIFETAETSEKVAINSTTKASKFMKFFKSDSHSEDERTSASGDNSTGDCDYDLKSKRLVIAPVMMKLTSCLKNDWELGLNMQRKGVMRQLLGCVQILPSHTRVNSKIQSNLRINPKSRDAFRKNYY